MPTWINFRELRERLDFRAVLEAYRVAIEERREGQHQGLCPLPTHSGEKRKPSFSVDLKKGIWQCFGCKAAGNILDFAVRMEGLDPQNGADVRTVSLQLSKRFLDQPSEAPRAAPRPEPRAPITPHATDVPVNPPLDFELKGLDAEHPFFVENGFQRETVLHFGAGYCQRGFLKGRIAIPLHGINGDLVGYAGRLVLEDEATEENPLYLYPESRERKGVLHRFDQGLLIYNAHRLPPPPLPKLAVVRDCLLVWHLRELGVPAVALLGGSVSETQRAVLGQLAGSGRVVFLSASLLNPSSP